ncbi:MAG: hypothetical protein HYS13_11060, partial [Planctomycetia bacterium]|nr:hypothetical protein [Planctomycetia bacterium]
MSSQRPISPRDQEQLLGYLLGALDDDEVRRLEERLRVETALKRELERLCDAMRGLDDGPSPAPPPDLAERACRFVKREARMLPQCVPLARCGGWSLRDAVAAAAVLLALLLLFFPMVGYSRYHADVTACQNNLRGLGLALSRFADRNGGQFPGVPVRKVARSRDSSVHLKGDSAADRESCVSTDLLAGPSVIVTPGIYASVLNEHGSLEEDSVIFCPASGTARSATIPSVARVQTASCEWKELRAMLGDYGYALGIVVNDRYIPVSNRTRSTFAVMADSPSRDLSGGASLNHGR